MPPSRDIAEALTEDSAHRSDHVPITLSPGNPARPESGVLERNALIGLDVAGHAGGVLLHRCPSAALDAFSRPRPARGSPLASDRAQQATVPVIGRSTSRDCPQVRPWPSTGKEDAIGPGQRGPWATAAYSRSSAPCPRRHAKQLHCLIH
jgi:hypothetical protein